MSARPDVLALACEQGGYDLRSLEAGYRLAKNATMLAEVAGQQGDARLTTWRNLVPSITALAEHMGYMVTDFEPVGDPAGVSIVLTPKVSA